MKRTVSICLCVSLILAALICAPSAVDSGDPKAEIPYADVRDTVTSCYWYNKMDVYYADEAAKADVPFGYNGYVMKIIGDSAVGITVDLSSRNIPVTSVKALHMRVYYSDKTREVRITTDAGVSWVLRHEAKKPGAWEDVVITDQSSLKKLADSNGRMGVFGFGFRNYEGTRNEAAYIDEIRVELIADDGVPPTIRYDGPDHIVTTEGKRFLIQATAWDETEAAEFPIQYVWNGDATDNDGKLIKGEYELALRASDSSGNTSEKKLTVTVGDRDTAPPVINTTLDKIETFAGAYPVLHFTADDDNDAVTVMLTWSEGALDRQGRLTAGTHVLTLTSSDLTGNTTERTVTVHAAG